MPRPPAWALAAVLLAVVAGGLALGLRRWFPEMGSLHGAGVQAMLDFTLVASAVFFVVGHVVLVYTLLRRPPIAPAPRSARQVALVVLLPALAVGFVAEGGVIALGLPVWSRYYGPPPPDAPTIEVTGRQFFWVVRYPGRDGRLGRTSAALIGTENAVGLDRDDPDASDDIVLLNELHLPVDRPVRLLLRSTDVIHSFFVPELRVKQDAMPGMSVPIWFTPTRAGEYEIACNQICGLGHYRMRGFLRVEPEPAFRAWLAEQAPFSSGP